ncbi:MAG: hypothetical protein GF398_05735 [Chitinivibrionales bacterium]|nr:hypothetical protein [Chitinivibrionales bacterium]
MKCILNGCWIGLRASTVHEEVKLQKVFNPPNVPDQDAHIDAPVMCANNNDYLLHDHNGTVFAWNWQTDDVTPIALTGGNYSGYSQFWHGDLPVATNNPLIAVEPGEIFVQVQNNNPSDAQVSITNAGGGTLCDVQASEDAAWLTVSVNGYTITNTIDPSQMSTDAATAMVTVSGGGAGNTATYTVSVTKAGVMAAPSDLQAPPLRD